MMAGGLREEADSMFNCAHLLVPGREVEPANPGKRDGARTHGAGFKRYVKIAVDKPLRAQNLPRCADRQDFRMGSRVLQFQRAVAGPRQDCARRVGYHGTHRHLSAGGGGFRLQ